MKLSDGVLSCLNYTISGLRILGVRSYSVIALIVFLGHGEVYYKIIYAFFVDSQYFGFWSLPLWDKYIRGWKGFCRKCSWPNLE